MKYLTEMSKVGIPNVTGGDGKKKLHKDFGKQRETARNRILVSMLVVFETDMTASIIAPFLLVNFGFKQLGANQRVKLKDSHK